MQRQSEAARARQLMQPSSSGLHQEGRSTDPACETAQPPCQCGQNRSQSHKIPHHCWPSNRQPRMSTVIVGKICPTIAGHSQFPAHSSKRPHHLRLRSPQGTFRLQQDPNGCVGYESPCFRRSRRTTITAGTWRQCICSGQMSTTLLTPRIL